MTGPKRSWAATLVKLGGAAVLIAAVIALAKRAPGRTTEDRPASPAPPPSVWPELVTYGIGYGVALALTIAAFAVVEWRWAPPSTALAIVFGLALVQIVVHFRCFLHVTLHGPARDDLQLILFSTLIVLLMVGGTLVILLNLRTRMM